MTTDSNRLHYEVDELIKAAAAAVEALEALPLGEAFDQTRDTAEDAIAVLEDPALRQLFPEYTRIGADEVAAFEFHEATFSRSAYGDHVLTLHAICLEAHPTLAALLRSLTVIERVRAHAEAGALATPDAQRAAGEAATDRYRRQLAMDLVGTPAFEPWANVLAIVSPELRRRVATEVQRREEYARAETARLAAEQQEADRIIAEQLQARVDRLRAYFEPRAGLSFLVNGRLFSGAGIAALAQRQGTYDGITGELVIDLPPLEALEVAMAQAQAADSVVAR